MPRVRARAVGGEGADCRRADGFAPPRAPQEKRLGQGLAAALLKQKTEKKTCC